MRLSIIQDKKRRLRVVDEYGDALPGIREAKIDYEWGNVPTLKLTIIIDNQRVSLGKRLKQLATEQEWI